MCPSLRVRRVARMPYMEKRKDGWLWVQRRVPRHLQRVIGSQWLRENTKTKDEPEYNKRSLPIIAKHNAILEQAERLSGLRPIIDSDGEVHPIRYILYGGFFPREGNLIYDQYGIFTINGNPPLDAIPVMLDERIVGYRLRNGEPVISGDDTCESWLKIKDKVHRFEGHWRDPLLEMSPVIRDGLIHHYRLIKNGETANSGVQAPQPVEFPDIIDLWAAERSIRPDTKRSTAAHIRRLTDFLGHTDMTRVSTDDIVQFRGALLKTGKVTERTAANHLMTITTLFYFAVATGKIGNNPVKGVGLKFKADPSAEPPSVPH
jgi:hypothetical protein